MNESASRLAVAQHEWLRAGAREKAESIRLLTRDLEIDSLLEIGAGSGAVLEALDELNYGNEYYALEPSSMLYQFLATEARISRLVETENATLQASALGKRRYDVAILSHVLEHVEDPSRLLSDALQVADHIVVEVPLEGSLTGNLRAWIKTVLTHSGRLNNPSGHIQFFSEGKISQLVQWAGGEVVASRLYSPTETARYSLGKQRGIRRAFTLATYTLSKILGQRIWATFYYGHFAVLIRRREAIAASMTTDWSGAYYYETPQSPRQAA